MKRPKLYVVDENGNIVKPSIWESMKQAVSDAMWSAGRFVKENTELITVAVPIITVGGVKIVKAIRSVINQHNNMVGTTKKKCIYDRSLDMWWVCKRELTNNERLKVEERKANGEKLGDILESMKLLKR